MTLTGFRHPKPSVACSPEETPRPLRSLRLAWLEAFALAALLYACLCPFPLRAEGPAPWLRQSLSPAEQAFLASRKEISLAPDPYFPPLEFIDEDGSYAGLVADLLRELEAGLGVKLSIARCKSWEEVLDGAKARRFDGVTAANRTPDREAYLLFTRPLIEIPNAIIVKDGGPSELKLERMAGMRLVLTKAYYLQELIAKSHPEIKLLQAKDSLEALQMVSFGKADATVENLAVASWLIQRHGISNLRVAGDAGNPMKLAIATRRDLPELNSIFDKAIAGIPPATRERIERKWIAMDSSAQDRALLKEAGIALAIIIGITGIVLSWNFTLHRRIAAKTRELKGELEERRRAEENYRFLLEHAADGILMGDLSGAVIDANERILMLSGYRKEELLGRNIAVLFEERELKKAPLRYDLLDVGRSLLVERTLRRSDGSFVDIEMNSKKLDAKTYQAIIRDISARKQAERELIKVKTLLEASIQQSPLGVLVAGGPDGKVMLANKATEQILGISAETLMKADLQNHLELKYRMEKLDGSPYAPDELPMVRALVKGEIVRNQEAVMVRSDMSRSVLSVNASPLRDGDGNVFAAMVVSSDVTEAKRSAEALDKKTRELNTLVENMSQGVILVDPDFRIIAHNKRMEEMLMMSEGHLSRNPNVDAIIDFCSEKGELPPEIRERARSDARRRDSFSREISYCGRTFEFRHSPLEGGGFVRTVNDLTERKLVEDALRKKTEALDTLVENVSQGIILTGPDLRVAAFNKRLLELLELPESLLAGSPHCSVIIDYAERMGRLPADSVRRARADILRNDSFVKEFKYCGRTLETRNSPLVGGGFVRTFTDLTERARAEEERLRMERDLLQAQKLESLGILAGGIAHDFNNLLLAIQGNIELAKAGVDARDRELFRRLSDAENAAMRAADLTRQMLAYSGQGSLQVRPLQLNSLVEEMLSLLEVSISKSVELELDLMEGLPLVMGDSSQLQQIVMNLIVNASEAMEGQPGVVKVSTSFRLCDARDLAESRLDEKPAPGPYVCFEVSDNGCGMDEATQRRLFEPFFTTKFTGRGLGMSAVLGIMRRHKGAIVMRSRKGEGSSFSMLFPEAPCQASQEMPDSRSGAGLGDELPPLSGRALVVDDEAMLRDLCASMLKSFGLEAVCASSGDEALNIYKEAPQGHFSCVLLDLTMPGKDGVAVFGMLREADPSVRVVMASGYSQEDVSRKLEGMGVAGYVQKPFMLSTLRGELAKALSGS